ncbi:MAG: hypothetical protein QXX52_08520 [Ignisphaera sp.]
MNDSTITSRERVLIALRHEEPDRVPIDFWIYTCINNKSSKL